MQVEGADAVIARIAARQYGVVTRAQLVAAGLGRGSIEHRVAECRSTACIGASTSSDTSWRRRLPGRWRPCWLAESTRS
jgi:hypothetical protein